MKNTLNYVAQVTNTLNDQLESIKETTKKNIFDHYSKLSELNKLLNDLSDGVIGEHTLDESGELIRYIFLSHDYVQLPYLNDYISQLDLGLYSESLKNGCVQVNTYCGPHISVQFGHSSDNYFVYDHDTNKPIIENEGDLTVKETYAKINEYQGNLGEFSYVIEIDNYGSFVRLLDINGEV